MSGPSVAITTDFSGQMSPGGKHESGFPKNAWIGSHGQFEFSDSIWAMSKKYQPIGAMTRGNTRRKTSSDGGDNFPERMAMCCRAVVNGVAVCGRSFTEHGCAKWVGNKLAEFLVALMAAVIACQMTSTYQRDVPGRSLDETSIGNKKEANTGSSVRLLPLNRSPVAKSNDAVAQ